MIPAIERVESAKFLGVDSSRSSRVISRASFVIHLTYRPINKALITHCNTHTHT